MAVRFRRMGRPSFGTESRHTKGSSGSTSSRGSRRLKTCRKLYSRIKQSIHGANVLTLMSTRRAWNPGQKLRSKYMHRYAYIYMYICRCVCIQADMCGYMHICRYVRTYACISDFMCSDCQFSTFGYQL
jgi:hypothetical protein